MWSGWCTRCQIPVKCATGNWPQAAMGSCTMSQLVFHVDQLQRAAEHQVGQLRARTDQFQRSAEHFPIVQQTCLNAACFRTCEVSSALHSNSPTSAFGTKSFKILERSANSSRWKRPRPPAKKTSMVSTRGPSRFGNNWKIPCTKPGKETQSLF